MRRMLRPGVAITAALVMLLLVATLAIAETQLLGGKLRTGDTVTVPAGEQVSDDLYIFAGTATIDGSVDGDLMAFGGRARTALAYTIVRGTMQPISETISRM